jgi:hypothetical protein
MRMTVLAGLTAAAAFAPLGSAIAQERPADRVQATVVVADPAMPTYALEPVRRREPRLVVASNTTYVDFPRTPRLLLIGVGF